MPPLVGVHYTFVGKECVRGLNTYIVFAFLELEIERLLRTESAKCRIVERLSGDAHLLFPRGEITLAVRVYCPKDMQRLNTTVHAAMDPHCPSNAPNLDGLEAFRDAFKYPVVFFILPDPNMMMRYLEETNSFVHVAQIIMNEGKHGHEPEGNAKTFVVPDARSVVDTILILFDALHPDRRKLRETYYAHTRSLHFVPDDDAIATGTVSDDMARHVSTHVENEFRDLAQRLGLAAGEDEILMTQLKSLAAIAAADYPTLQQLPLEESTKRKLHDFFGSQANPYPVTGGGIAAADNHHHDHYAIHDDNQTLSDEFGKYNEFQQAHNQTFYPPPNPTQVAPFHQRMTSAVQYSLPQENQPVSHQDGYHQNEYADRYHNSHFSSGQYPGDQDYDGHHHNDRIMMAPLQPMDYFPSHASPWLPAAQSSRPYTGVSAFAPNYSQQRQQQFHRHAQTANRRFQPSGYLPGNSGMGQYYV